MISKKKPNLKVVKKSKPLFSSSRETKLIQVHSEFLKVPQDVKDLLYKAVKDKDPESFDNFKLPPSRLLQLHPTPKTNSTCSKYAASTSASKSFLPGPNFDYVSKQPMHPLVIDHLECLEEQRKCTQQTITLCMQKYHQLPGNGEPMTTGGGTNDTEMELNDIEDYQIFSNDDDEMEDITGCVGESPLYPLCGTAHGVMDPVKQIELGHHSFTPDQHDSGSKRLGSTHSGSGNVRAGSDGVAIGSGSVAGSDDVATGSGNIAGTSSSTIQLDEEDPLVVTLRDLETDDSQSTSSYEKDLEDFDRLCSEIDANLLNIGLAESLRPTLPHYSTIRKCSICGTALKAGSTAKDLEDHMQSCCPMDDIIVIDDDDY